MWLKWVIIGIKQTLVFRLRIDSDDLFDLSIESNKQ